MTNNPEANWKCCICLRMEYGYANGCIFLHKSKAHPICFSLRELTMERMWSDDRSKYLAHAEELYGQFDPAIADGELILESNNPPRFCSLCRVEIKNGELEVLYGNCVHGSEHMHCTRARCYMRRFYYCNECPCDPMQLSALVQNWCGTANKEVVSMPSDEDVPVKKVPAATNILIMIETRTAIAYLMKWFSGTIYMVGDALCPTIAKAVSMELNRRALQKNATPVPTPLMFFLTYGYTAEDCIKMGLDFRMVCDNVGDWNLLLDMKRFNVYALRRLGCTFLAMLFAGVKLEQIRDAHYSLKDLDDIGFNAPAFMAVNGTISLLSEMINYADNETGKSIAVRFGFTQDMLDSLEKNK